MAEQSISIPVSQVPGVTSVSLTATSKALKELIKRRHPKYDAKREHWEFMEATYEGGRDWFEANIFPYIKEGEKEFADRKKRAYRFNHTREVVDLLNKYLFRQVIGRNLDDAPEPLITFWKKSTRNGLGINDLSRQISKMSSIYGRIGIVVDNNTPASPVTVAEAARAGWGAYAYIVTPTQMLDYSFDDHGELNWILIEEAYRDDEDPFSKGSGVEKRWRLWTKTEWTLFKQGEKKGEIVIVVDDEGVHNLKRVPVILHDNIISDEEWCSQALIDEIAYLDRAVANYLSNLDAIIQDQTFSQLVMPAQGIMPGEEAYTKMLEMGTKRMFLYDGEGGVSPSYISPDVKQANLIVQAVQKIINEIYHTVGLAGERTKEDNSVGIDNSSGVAKAYDFERVNSLLAAKADSLEVTENRIADLVAAWSDLTLDKPLVGYPDNFDTRGLYDEFDIAARLILVEAPDEIRREQMLAVITKLFPMIGDDKRKAMEEELKNWPPDPIEQAGLMAEATAVNKPTASAPNGKDQPKAKKNNRQGQVTRETSK